jgi:hypothetical protein
MINKDIYVHKIFDCNLTLLTQTNSKLKISKLCIPLKAGCCCIFFLQLPFLEKVEKYFIAQFEIFFTSKCSLQRFGHVLS